MNHMLWTVFAGIFLFSWNRINKNRFQDALSPFNSLIFSWIGPLLLKGYNASALENDWPFDVKLIVGWVTLCLVVPCFMAKTWIGSRSFDNTNNIFDRIIKMVQNRKFLFVLISAFIISFSAFLYAEIITNPAGIAMFTLANDPRMSRDDIHRWGKQDGGVASYFAMFLYVLVPVLYLAYRVRKQSLFKWVLFVLVFIYPVMSLLKLSRIDFICTMISLFFVRHYYKKFYLDYRPKKVSHFKVLKKVFLLILCIPLGYLFFEAYSKFIEIRSNSTMDAVGRRLLIQFDFFPDFLQGFMIEFYSYFALPFENFSNFYQTYTGGFKLGVGALRPFFSILGQGSYAQDLFETIDFDFRLWPVNTYPFITLIYAELGLAGVLVIPMLYSVMVNFIYVRFRREPNFVNFLLYVNCPFGWLWLFAAAGFTVLTFYLNMIFIGLLFFVYRILLKRERSFYGLETIRGLA